MPGKTAQARKIFNYSTSLQLQSNMFDHYL